ncbi:MAG: hypothetical protein ETSY1_34940 [Candidatus Entotheonella factor]|uniref:Uncharacterized protein n=1 Tax=Entotheonella factor TaxID=1429438 RepID=W4LAS7_ENTF1|nr:MAG: hypothetical protein ETSY1_34940 [Candidatus Entotheonella factor]
MRHFFVDTFYLIALSYPRDQWHQRVMLFSQRLTNYRLYTVDEVLSEFLTYCGTSGPRMRTNAARTVRQALDNPLWTVIAQSRSTLLDALNLYESRPDKDYSLTDCVSMQTMRREGWTEVLTNDHHFEQEGFTRLFR